MSHIVTIETQVKDAGAVREACKRLELAPPVQGTAELFSGDVEGLVVQLPDWIYPICCDLTAGRLHYDNFEGRWGEQAHLDRFLQMYAVEKTKLEARRRGRSVTERTMEDGSIHLTVQLA